MGIKPFIVAALLLAGSFAGAETGFRGGGAWGAGSAARYGGSFHGSLFFGRNVGDQGAVGVDLMFDTQHIAKPGADVGLAGKQHYDAKINAGALTAYGRRELSLGDSLAISGTLGAGVYQVNTFEGCRDQTRGDCVDHHGLVGIASDNRLGFNAGLGLMLRLTKAASLGPEIRFHQLVGGGRMRRPGLVTGAIMLAIR